MAKRRSRGLSKKSEQHVEKTDDVRTECKHVPQCDVVKMQSSKANCSVCDGSARWQCLRSDCAKFFCGNKAENHAEVHFNDEGHSVFVHVSNNRVLCFHCGEVNLNNNEPPFSPQVPSDASNHKRRRRDSSSKSTGPLNNNNSGAPSVKRNHKRRADTKGRLLDECVVQNRAIMKDMEDAFEDDFPKGLTGLYNLGNTCYFNSAVQALSNCPPFVDYFRDKGDLRLYSISSREPLVSQALMLVMQRLWAPQRQSAISPATVLARLRDKMPQFRGWNQQDAQELIRCLLELVHRELARPVFKYEEFARKPKDRQSSTSSGSNDGDIFETADSGWSSDGDSPSTSTHSSKGYESAKPVRLRSIVSDVFDGAMESNVKCLTCLNVSTTTETFQDLSLPIPSGEQLDRVRSHESAKLDAQGKASGMWTWLSWFGSLPSMFFSSTVSLEDCFGAFFSPDSLVGDDMYRCEKCNKLRNGVKTCRISRFPEVLCVHIKRFRHDSYSSSKVSTQVSFPLVDLDMSAFGASDVRYNLCAFVTHEGGSADNGHYTACCLNEVDGNWYEYDDAIVTKLDSAYVQTKEAYVLFYQRQASRVVESARQSFSDAISPVAVATRSGGQTYISTEWLSRLSSFASPGPITNFDFLCRHGNLLPQRVRHISQLCTRIPGEVFDYLQKSFGGGPRVDQLHYCLICDKQYTALCEKRTTELQNYRRLVEELKMLSECPETLYQYYLPQSLLSKSWFERWENFLCDIYSEPPGPIDNEILLVKSDDGMRLRKCSNSIIVAREMFVFFREIYGGGPEVFLTDDVQCTEDELSKITEEVDSKLMPALEKFMNEAKE